MCWCLQHFVDVPALFKYENMQRIAKKSAKRNKTLVLQCCRISESNPVSVSLNLTPATLSCNLEDERRYEVMF